jgi:copper(I)-binding protein
MLTRSVTALLFSASLAATALAHDYQVGALKIEHPWTRATPKGAKIGGGYFKITNIGSMPDRLVGGSFADSARFELHSMNMDDGVMRMRPIPNGIEIKPGETVELKPEGLHVMFVDLQKPIAEGDRIKGTLVFEVAGTVEIEFEAAGLGGPAAPAESHGASH